MRGEGARRAPQPTLFLHGGRVLDLAACQAPAHVQFKSCKRITVSLWTRTRTARYATAAAARTSPPSSMRQKGSRAGASGRGRLIFALDATMSRQPTWDLAQSLQAKMFEAAGSLGGLDVQLVYFRGLNECRASNFVSGGQGLAQLMSRIEVRGGSTQIRRVLAHARDEAEARESRSADLHRRRHGGESGPARCDSGRARAARRQGVHVPGRAGPRGEAHVQRDRPPDRRGL